MGDLINYYSRKDIQKAIVKVAKDREVAVKFEDGGFGKRPDILQFENDVYEFAKQGATSFHLSEEHWTNPQLLKAGMTKKQLDEIRKGWDMIIDVDSKNLEYSKICANLILEALKFHDVANISVKFSGNLGFHIAIPFTSFPKKVNGQSTNLLFPEGPKVIASYLKEMIKEHLKEEILKKGLNEDKDLNPFSIVDIDTILISNRHMFRAPYSVAYSEPILIKNRGEIKIIKIGEYVDSFFDKELNFQKRDISHLNYKTCSLNLNKNYKTKFRNINRVIRHKMKGSMYKIHLESGRKVKVTAGHSLFTIKNGKIKTIKGDKVCRGDYIIVPQKLNLQNITSEINLVESILNVAKNDELKYIFLCDFNKNIFDYLFKFNKKQKTKFKNIYNWKRYNVLPLSAYKKLSSNDKHLKDLMKNSKLKLVRHGGKAYKIDNILKLDKGLMRLLGYYSSEGHCDKLNNKGRKYRITFSFGSHEKNLINDCKKLIKRSLKIPITIRQPHKTATQIIINSSILNFIFIKLFCCGRTSNKKRVPTMVWNVSEVLKKEYLKGYLMGDGHLEKRWSKNSVAAVSNRLKKDLSFLLTSLGLNFTLTNKVSRGISNKLCYANVINISGKEDIESLNFVSKNKFNKSPMIRRYPIKELGLEKQILKTKYKSAYSKGKVKTRSKEWILRNLKPDKEIIKILNGNMGFLKVKSIKKVNYNNKYVYDLSVQEDENFVGGECILLHNSYHEKSGLVSIPISPDKILEFNKEDAKIENVKTDIGFLDNDESNEGKASKLILQAFDWDIKNKKQEVKVLKNKTYELPKIAISDKYFPPCIKLLADGVKEDGRKRGLFILTNFLRGIGYKHEEMEEFILDWNKRNYQPLKEGYIRSQLEWSKKKNEVIPPQNCPQTSGNENIYNHLKICHPDNLCKMIKNPLQYAKRKSKFRKNKKKN